MVFFWQPTGCRCVVHGDGSEFLTYDDTGRQVANEMAAWYDLKLRAVIGVDAEEDKEGATLNKTLKHVRRTRV